MPRKYYHAFETYKQASKRLSSYYVFDWKHVSSPHFPAKKWGKRAGKGRLVKTCHVVAAAIKLFYFPLLLRHPVLLHYQRHTELLSAGTGTERRAAPKEESSVGRFTERGEAMHRKKLSG